MYKDFSIHKIQPNCISGWLTCFAEMLKKSAFLKFKSICCSHIKTKTGSKAFSISGRSLWNALRNAQTILTFRKIIKSHQSCSGFPTLDSPAPCWRTCFGLDYDTWSCYWFVRLWARLAEDIGAIEVLLLIDRYFQWNIIFIISQPPDVPAKGTSNVTYKWTGPMARG